MARRFNIAITGSGTAGLAAACFLTQAGHNITLFERFDAPRPVGAGLMLQPTGLACLACLGLDEAAIETGAKIHNLYGATSKSKNNKAKVIFDLDYRNLSPTYFGLGIHRGALFTLLFEKLKTLSVTVQTNRQITSSYITADQRFLIDAQDSHYGPFDLVIDASGKSSQLRKTSSIGLNKPYPYGALWGVVEDPNQAFGGNRLAQRYKDAQIMTGMLAIGKNPETNIDSAAFFWSLPADKLAAWDDTDLQDWKDGAVRLWPELAPFLAQFKTNQDLNKAYYGDIIMRSWRDDRLIHIGDAAHHSSPQLGQGVNLALADALILSQALEHHADVNTALATYQQQRKSHVLFYQKASRMLTPFFQSDSKIASKLRDLSFGTLCKTPFIKTQMLRTLAGIKTGWLSHMDPGSWHKAYSLKKSQKKGPQ